MLRQHKSRKVSQIRTYIIGLKPDNCTWQSPKWVLSNGVLYRDTLIAWIFCSWHRRVHRRSLYYNHLCFSILSIFCVFHTWWGFVAIDDETSLGQSNVTSIVYGFYIARVSLFLLITVAYTEKDKFREIETYFIRLLYLRASK